MNQVNLIFCYVCGKRMLHLDDAELFNVKVDGLELYHREIGHSSCIGEAGAK